MTKEVVLTGLRANAEFHIGNYLGGILPMVQLQKKHAGRYQLNMFIPDLHSFTTPIDHGKLYEQTHQNLKVFVAAGLDIDEPNTFIYRQSYIPAHSELTWILDCFANVGSLKRMTAFKEKTDQTRDLERYANAIKKVKEIQQEFDKRKNEFKSLVPDQNTLPEKVMTKLEHAGDMAGLTSKTLNEFKSALNSLLSAEMKSGSATVGLFNYPVLMAADILLYGAKWVPVGEDQRQHVEFARDLATRFNNKFGEIFVLPADNDEQLKFAEREKPVRIRSLRNPEKKMSKSVEDPAGTIMLSDNPDEAAKKVMEATTDSAAKVSYNFGAQPGISNLLQILALLDNRSQSEVNQEHVGKTSYGDFKELVAGKIKLFLDDLQAKLAAVDDQKLMKKLEDDEAAMRKVADATLLKVQKAVGLRPA